MGKPEGVLDERPVSKAEMEKLHRWIDMDGRQMSLEIIFERTHKYENKSYAELIEIVEGIRETCEEWI